MSSDNTTKGDAGSPQDTGPRPARGLQPLSPGQAGFSRFGLGVGILVVVVGLGFWFYRRHGAPAAGPSAAKGGDRAAQVIPVGAVAVARKDVPIYLDGLGSVQAFNTVTVQARVDGELERVAFVEGQDVRRGDVLAQIDPRPYKAALDQAKAKKGQDEAQLANARVQLARDKELLESKILAQQDFDTQQALVDQLVATVQADQAAIDSAQVQLDYTTVVSPLDGRTGVRQVDAGNVVHASGSNGLVVITQLRPISVLFTLPQQHLGEIQKQMAQGTLTVLSLERNNRSVLGTGKLVVIDNQIDSTTGTIRLKATFANDDLRLWPGQFVNVRLWLKTRAAGLVVPESAIQRGPQGAYAFVIQGEGQRLSVEPRPVKVAQIQDGEALVDGGLEAGERVVVEGQYRLQAGSPVKLRAARGPGAGPESEGE